MQSFSDLEFLSDKNKLLAGGLFLNFLSTKYIVRQLKIQEEELKAQKKTIENEILLLEKELAELKRTQKADLLKKRMPAPAEQKPKWFKIANEFMANEAKKLRNRLFLNEALTLLDESFGFKRVRQFTLDAPEIKHLISFGKLTQEEAGLLLPYQISCLGYGFNAIKEGVLTSKEVLDLRDVHKAEVCGKFGIIKLLEAKQLSFQRLKYETTDTLTKFNTYHSLVLSAQVTLDQIKESDPEELNDLLSQASSFSSVSPSRSGGR